MKRKYRWLWALAALLLLAALALWRAQPGESPDKAEVDLSRLDRGVVSVRYTAGAAERVKVQITKTDGIDYNYDLNAAGAWETFALTQGDGTYTLRVLEHLAENRYTPVYTTSLTLALTDPLGPYLEPNQFVRYTADSKAAVLAGELTAGMESDGEKTAALLAYVTQALVYDQEKADGVASGYLPDVDRVLEEERGICFDYAVLLCAMLRSVEVPCRLAVGDCGKEYHAWVEVWCETEGEACGIPLVPNAWTRLDPTFLSARGQTEDILDYIRRDGNYRTKYVY